MSLINGEKSPIRVERSSMSAEADVLEMQSLCSQIADRLAESAAQKDRVRAVKSAVKKQNDQGERVEAFGWNRVLEFLCGKARRIDSWEKDLARETVAELKDAERRRRDLEHLEWLESEIARHRAAGEELRGPHIDGLLHFLRVGRGPFSAVEVPRKAADCVEDPNDFSD